MSVSGFFGDQGLIENIANAKTKVWCVITVFKTTQLPQTKFTACCLQWTATNQTLVILGYVQSNHF